MNSINNRLSKLLPKQQLEINKRITKAKKDAGSLKMSRSKLDKEIERIAYLACGGSINRKETERMIKDLLLYRIHFEDNEADFSKALYEWEVK